MPPTSDSVGLAEVEIPPQAVRWNGHYRMMRSHGRPRFTAFAVPPEISPVMLGAGTGTGLAFIPTKINGGGQQAVAQSGA